MYKDTVFFFRPHSTSLNCLKVFNKAGDELSLSGDDSCGAMEHLSRLSLAIFPEGKSVMKEEATFVTPVQLLEKLAEHLGYSIVER